MSRIRGKNTKPEIALRSALWRKGYRYRLHARLPGRPDLVFPGSRVAVFVDGCFWHKCPRCYTEPASNKAYWLPKIERNVQRDREADRALRQARYRVIRIWEHVVDRDPARAVSKIEKALSRR